MQEVKRARADRRQIKGVYLLSINRSYNGEAVVSKQADKVKQGKSIFTKREHKVKTSKILKKKVGLRCTMYKQQTLGSSTRLTKGKSIIEEKH